MELIKGYNLFKFSKFNFNSFYLFCTGYLDYYDRLTFLTQVKRKQKSVIHFI